jgi:hypothetical protein
MNVYDAIRFKIDAKWREKELNTFIERQLFYVRICGDPNVKGLQFYFTPKMILKEGEVFVYCKFCREGYITQMKNARFIDFIKCYGVEHDRLSTQTYIRPDTKEYNAYMNRKIKADEKRARRLEKRVQRRVRCLEKRAQRLEKCSEYTYKM